MDHDLKAQLDRIEAKLDRLLPKPREPKISVPRERSPAQKANDALLLALAGIEVGRGVEVLSPSEARRYGVAAAQIRAVTPGVTPEEINRRAANYRVHLVGCPVTANALAKHWRKCDMVTDAELAAARKNPKSPYLVDIFNQAQLRNV